MKKISCTSDLLGHKTVKFKRIRYQTKIWLVSSSYMLPDH